MMKALAKFGPEKEPGGYRLVDVPEPSCGPRDVVIEVKAAAICGADMPNFGIENQAKELNHIRGHEFSGIISEVGEEVVDWKIGQRVVSDNTGYVCGKCPSCEAGDFLTCKEKINIGFENNPWGGGFTKYCLIPGELLAVHRHAIWELPEKVSYEEACLLDPICNGYKAIAQRTKFLPGQDVVVIGAGPIGLFCVQIAKIMGASNIIVVGLERDKDVRFDIALKVGATHVVNGSKEEVVTRCQEICGKDNLGLVMECSGSGSGLQQAIEMVRSNGEIVRMGNGYKPLDFQINAITSWAISIIGHMAYDSTTWRNAIRLLEFKKLDIDSMITHRLGLSEWEKGFQLMADKEAVKVVFTYDFDE
ncbi:zinc-binding dehydrogenase [Enterococcus sp. AZ128]|uniref:zinc-binding dehydrogenase n=1 Tax=unclassified Enterococcus TaxID=2608891 RepID=UPI003F6856F6